MHFWLFRAVVDSNEQGSEDGEDDSQCRNDQGKENGGNASEVIRDIASHVIDDIIPQHHSSEYSCYVRTEQVGSHPSDVSDVVSHIVCNRCRVARVVLGDSRFYFSDEVSSHIGRFRVDATAHSCEECDGFGTQ